MQRLETHNKQSCATRSGSEPKNYKVEINLAINQRNRLETFLTKLQLKASKQLAAVILRGEANRRITREGAGRERRCQLQAVAIFAGGLDEMELSVDSAMIMTQPLLDIQLAFH